MFCLQGGESVDEEHSPAATTSKSSNSTPLPRPHHKMTVNSQSGPTDDLISTATSALRRLHFKTGRMSSGKAAAAMAAATKIPARDQVVPKVVVMGKSSHTLYAR